MQKLSESGKQSVNKVMGVYRIVNILSNKVYIGSSKDIYERFYRHVYRAEKTELKSPLYTAIRKDGIDNFVCEIIENVDDESKLGERENFYINKYKSNQEEFGYNFSDGRVGHWIITEAVKEKISEGVKKNWITRKENK